MTVNELARRAGIPAHVVRYYTQCGLLTPARNSRNAYREYRETDLRRLRFICKAKTMGFTLSEIDMILKAADDEVSSLDGIRELLFRRLEQHRRELTSAERLQQRIMDAIDKWNAPGGAAVTERAKLVRLIEAVLCEDDSGPGLT
jgi:DNA-binding transcriptional MerR regulator